MKLDKLMVENFRVFRGRTVFNFGGKDFVVISGSNGNGKSTLFDAIMWCFTGKIPRYDGSREPQRFDYIINDFENLSMDAKARVEIWLKDYVTSEQHKIVREYWKQSPHAHVWVDGKECTVSEAESLIQNLVVDGNFSIDDSSTIDERISLTQVLSSTQLLSQDTLDNFIRNSKPTDRYKLMDAVLGLQRYGTDLEDYLKLSLRRIKDRLEYWDKERNNTEKKWIGIKSKLAERERVLSNLGDLTEEGLIVAVNRFLKNAKIDAVNTEAINEQFMSSLRKIYGQLADEIEQLESRKSSLDSVKNVVNVTADELVLESTLTRKNLEVVRRQLERRNKGIERAKYRERELVGFNHSYAKYKETSILLENLKGDRQHLEERKSKMNSHPQLLRIVEKYGTYTQFEKAFNNSKAFLGEVNWAIEAGDRLRLTRKLTFEITELSSQVTKTESDIKKLTEALLLVNEELKTLRTSIESKKESQVEQIIHQVQAFIIERLDTESYCPVCGSNFESYHELHNAVRAQIELANGHLTELEKQHRDLVTRRESLAGEIGTLNIALEKLQGDIRARRNDLEKEKAAREKLLAMVGPQLTDKTQDDLVLLREQLQESISGDQIAFSLVEEYNLLDSAIHQTRAKENIYVEQLNDLERRHHRWASFYQSTQSEVLRYIERVRTYIHLSAEDVKKCEEQLSDLTGKLGKNESLARERVERLQVLKTMFHDVPATLVDVQRKIADIQSEINLKSGNRVELRDFITKCETFLSKNEVVQLRELDRSYKLTTEKCESNVKYYDELQINTEKLKTHHSKIKSQLLNDVFETHNQLIDRLFMQITPHPFYKHVRITTIDGSLYVVMKKSQDNKRLNDVTMDELRHEFNASLTFSAAQSNVLAVCIFLALSLQRQMNLQFIGLDDPFQSLDDINAFSFIDVLSEIVSVRQKQILISTHNDDFAYLMKAKMPIVRDRVGTIHFTSYGEEGVGVEGNCVVSPS